MKRQVKLRRLIADGWRPDHMGTGTPPTPGEADCMRLKCFRLQPDGRVKRDHTRRQTRTRALAGRRVRPAQIIHVSQMPRAEYSLKIQVHIEVTVLDR